MLGEVTFTHGDIEARLTTSMLASFRYNSFRSRMPAFEDAVTQSYSDTFLLVSAYTVEVTAGMDWQPMASPPYGRRCSRSHCLYPPSPIHHLKRRSGAV